ncbi:MAG: protein kinase [bacterium]|nr:protein kinase [bacterium]
MRDKFDKDDLSFHKTEPPVNIPAGVKIDQEIPQRIGDYKIISNIGHGAMGVVYEAYQTSLKRKVAIKVIPQSLSAFPEIVKRFEIEATSAAQLRHPNIVTIFEFGKDNHIYFYAMEYIHGKTLEDKLKKEKIPLEKALNLIVRIGEGLSYAHEHGIIHRDIKPSNIIIDEEGHPLIADFGLAKVEETEEITSNKVMGTPSYMSPEQANPELKNKIDKRSDIFSLGVLFYRMLVGEVPFKGRSNLEIIKKIAEQDPKYPRKANPEIPVDIEAVILKSIEKAPANRYQTVREFIDDINRFRNGELVLARRPSSFDRMIRRIRKYKFLSMAIAAIVIISISSGSYIISQKILEMAKWTLIFEDNFNRREIGNNWEAFVGNRKIDLKEDLSVWKIENGELSVQSWENAFIILKKIPVSGDLKMTFDAYTVPPHDNNIQCFICDETRTTGYVFHIGGWKNQKTAITKGYAPNILDQTSLLKVEPDRNYKIKVEKVGKNVKLFVDNRLILRIVDYTPFISMENQYAGLDTWGSHVKFDNFKLYKLSTPLKTSPLVAGEKFLERGLYSESINEFNEIINTYANRKEIVSLGQFWIGMAYEKMEQYYQAINEYQKIIKLYPEYEDLAAHSMYHIGLCYLSLGLEKEADRVFLECLRKFPRNAVLSNIVSTYTNVINQKLKDLRADTIHISASDLSSLEEHLSFLVTNFPEHKNLYCDTQVQIGEAWTEFGDLTRARLAFQNILLYYGSYRAQCALALNKMANIYRHQKRFEDAVSTYEKVNRTYGDQRYICAWNQIDLSHCYRLMGKINKCIEALKDCMVKYSDMKEQYGWALIWHADVCYDVNDIEDAEHLLKEVTYQFAKSGYEVIHSISLFYLGQLAYKDLEHVFSNGTNEFNNDPPYFIGRKFYFQSDFPQTIEYMQKCVKETKGIDWPLDLALKYIEDLSE